ncbi:MAG TPA: DUF504 domain-containing protein [Nitrosopumilaceae archaeon]|nr:DUF504 domain-containing protein [Nitrosopumilaceae archaeon]
MSRKGRLSEIFSKAQYADDPTSYTVGYLDYDMIKEVTLPEFIKESDNFETIPITRIQFVKKGNRILFSKHTQ